MMNALRKKILEQIRGNGSMKPLVEQLLKEHIHAEPNDMSRLTCSPSDGGPHQHTMKPLADNQWLVTSDGSDHRHFVQVEDHAYETECDGDHVHTAATDDLESSVDGAHTHHAIVDGRLFESSPGSPHSHELLAGGTAFDGSHQHTFKIDGKTVKTQMPAANRADRSRMAEKLR